MRLFASSTSPFVRKVSVLIREAGLTDQVEVVPVTGGVTNPGTMPLQHNPLGKIPALERPTGGRILVNELDVGQLRAAAIPYLRRSLGLVTQDSRLLLDRTVFDNVQLPLLIAGLPRREAEHRASAALERVGLARHAKAMPIT